MSSIFAVLAGLLRGDARASIDLAALPEPLGAIAHEALALADDPLAGGDPALTVNLLPRRDDSSRVSAFVRASEGRGLSTRQIDRLLAAAFAFDAGAPANDSYDEVHEWQAILDAPHDPTPALPPYALVDEALGAGACPWLDRYIAFSRIWSPRAFDAFHEACGIWLLSTVAARRVTLQLGHPRYTNLYLALVARSSLYTKSTAAEIAVATLQSARLDWLLAPDDSTPQRFIHDLTASARAADGSGPNDEWARLRQAFAAQRGWYYEEFGQHLEAMIRGHGALAQFRSILKRFDDGRERYELATLARGSELVERPYLALLACMTPADLRPLARLGAALWHDGYLARFAFVTPGDGNRSRSRAPFPPGERVIPAAIVESLRDWHKQLGIPIFPVRALTGADDEAQSAAVSPVRRVVYGGVPVQKCVGTPAVYDAFYNYHNALLELAGYAGSADLDASYARHAEKALRVAMLLASMENGGQIELRHWARAQAIAERWRSGLHALVAQLNEPAPSHRRLMEQRILEVVRRKGKPTAADVTNYIRNLSTSDAHRILDSLVKVGILETEPTYKGTLRYSVK
jgi:hypothetical protein